MRSPPSGGSVTHKCEELACLDVRHRLCSLHPRAKARDQMPCVDMRLDQPADGKISTTELRQGPRQKISACPCPIGRLVRQGDGEDPGLPQRFEFGSGKCSLRVALGGELLHPRNQVRYPRGFIRQAPGCENVHGVSLPRAHTRSGAPCVLEQMEGMIDLAWQFAEPHAAARQERAGRFDAGPGTPEIPLGEHAIQKVRGDPKINGEFGRERLPPPGSPHPAAEVVAPIRVYGRLNLLVGKLILPLHAATDGVGHAAWRTTDHASRYRHHDRWIMPDPCVDAGERADECAVLAGRKCRNATTPTKCRWGYRQARTRRLGVARQGIGGIRIEPIRYAIEQLNQPAFQHIIGLKVGGDERRLRRMKYGLARIQPRHPRQSLCNCARSSPAPPRRRRPSSRERHPAAPVVPREPWPTDAPDLHWRAAVGSHGIPHPIGRAAPASSRKQSQAFHHCNCWQAPSRREGGMSGEPMRADKLQCVRPRLSQESRQR